MNIPFIDINVIYTNSIDIENLKLIDCEIITDESMKSNYSVAYRIVNDTVKKIKKKGSVSSTWKDYKYTFNKELITNKLNCTNIIVEPSNNSVKLVNPSVPKSYIPTNRTLSVLSLSNPVNFNSEESFIAYIISTCDISKEKALDITEWKLSNRSTTYYI